tara:strand:+ start:614 stop:874 length:261 start_codon:yes stop_codon:yes gene_type:complete
MIIEIEHDWYDSSGNSYEGVPTTFEISSQRILGDEGIYTDYTARLLYMVSGGETYGRDDVEATFSYVDIVTSEATAEEYCAEGFTE